MPASYAWTALANCFERVRCGEVDLGEEDAIATEVLRDSTFDGFWDLRAAAPRLGFALFRAAGFAAFTFKRMDLVDEDGRRAAFLVGLGFAFAFVAMSPATYTGSTS